LPVLAEAVATVLALSSGARRWRGGWLRPVYAVAVAIAVVVSGAGNARLRWLLRGSC
jgi:hypothetical protein